MQVLRMQKSTLSFSRPKLPYFERLAVKGTHAVRSSDSVGLAGCVNLSVKRKGMGLEI